MDAQLVLATRYASDLPTDAANRLEGIDPADAGALLVTLDPQVAAAILAAMTPTRAAAVIETMPPAGLSEVVGRLPSARRVLILRQMSTQDRSKVMAALPKKTAGELERLLSWEEGTVGRLAEPVAAVLKPNMTVAEGRHAALGLAEADIYVVDVDHTLIGAADRRTLATSREDATVGTVMSRAAARLPASSPLTTALRHQAWEHHDALPVVDSTGVLIGLLRHRRLRGTGHGPPITATTERSPLVGFLELGELYWGGLATTISALAGSAKVAPPEEVDRES